MVAETYTNDANKPSEFRVPPTIKVCGGPIIPSMLKARIEKYQDECPATFYVEFGTRGMRESEKVVIDSPKDQMETVLIHQYLTSDMIQLNDDDIELSDKTPSLD